MLKEAIRETIDHLKRKKVDYADIRHQKRNHEEIRVKNGNVDVLSWNQDQGFGIRVIKNGAWGFAASSVLNPGEMKRVAHTAVEIARASAITKKEEVRLTPTEIYQDTYSSDFDVDPFGVATDKKIGLLLDACDILRKSPKIRVGEASMQFFKTDKIFASTEGAFIEQSMLESGAGMTATGVDGSGVQRRSYPNSFGGDYASRGYEFVEELKLLENADKTREEALELLSAPLLSQTETTVILSSNQMAFQAHETCGRPTELDLVLGTERSLGHRSFITPDKLNRLKFGSEKVTVVADATIRGGLGSFGYDDEGVKAQRTYLIKNGLFVGYQTSREMAAVLNQKSNGTMRADGWKRIPLIRMTNINLEPGEWELEDLIKDTKDGLFLDTNKVWSIDDKRLNFQYAVEACREIKNGRLGRMFRNAFYSGITPLFWHSCDAVCNRKHWRIWGLLNDGKGEPMQVIHQGNGASPARFHNITVGGSK